MRWMTAAALLAVLTATPALALVCDALCATPAANVEAHAHHAKAKTQQAFQAGSRLQASGPTRNCASHLLSDAVAPASASFPTAEPLRAAGLDEQTRDLATAFLPALRPPWLVPRTPAPLRI